MLGTSPIKRHSIVIYTGGIVTTVYILIHAYAISDTPRYYNDLPQPAFGWDIQLPRNQTRICPTTSNKSSIHTGVCNLTLKGVIIHSKYRSGSTYASEFFKRNQHFYYVYEPLYFIPILKTLTNYVDILRYSLTCNFHKLAQFADPKRLAWLHHQMICQIGQTPGCPHVSPNQAIRVCQSRKYVAVKLIRLTSLEQVVPLMQEGYKTVYVLRDPRAVMHSRVTFKKLDDEEFISQVKEYCMSAIIDLLYMRQMMQQNTSSVSQCSYIFQRYEDLVMAPQTSMDRFYKILGIEPDSAVKRWTRTTEKLLRNISGSSIRPKWPFVENAYSTFRTDPVLTSQKWRMYMSFDRVQIVQQSCRALMKVLGYKMADSHRQVRDLQQTLVDPWDTEWLYGCGVHNV